MPTASERHRILPDVGVGVLPVEGLSRGADSEQPVDRESWSLRQTRRSRHADISSTDRLSDHRISIESHIAKARDIHKVRMEDVRVRKDEHVVLIQLVCAPAGHIGSEG